MFLHKYHTTKHIVLLIVFILCVNTSVKAQKEIPENIKGILLEGVTAIDSAKVPQDVDKAIDLFKKAVKLAPDFPEAHYYLGRTLMLIEGNTRSAVKEFNKYLALYPDAPDKESVTAEIGKLENTLKIKRNSSLMGVELMAMNGGIYIRRVQELAVSRGQSRMQHLIPGERVLKINGEDLKESNLQDVLNKINENADEKIELTVMGSGEAFKVTIPKSGNKGLIKALDEEDLHELISASAKVVVIWSSDESRSKGSYLGKVNSFINANSGIKAYQVNVSKNKMADVEFNVDTEALPAVYFYKDGKLVDSVKGFQPDVFEEKAKVLTE